MGGSIKYNVYDYDYNDERLGYFVWGSTYDCELREFEKCLINDSQNIQNFLKTKFTLTDRNRLTPQRKQIFIILTIFGV